MRGDFLLHVSLGPHIGGRRARSILNSVLLKEFESLWGIRPFSSFSRKWVAYFTRIILGRRYTLPVSTEQVLSNLTDGHFMCSHPSSHFPPSPGTCSAQISTGFYLSIRSFFPFFLTGRPYLFGGNPNRGRLRFFLGLLPTNSLVGLF